MVSLLAGAQIKWGFVDEVQEGAKVRFSVDLVWELIFVVCPSVLCSEVCTEKSGFVSQYNIEKKNFLKPWHLDAEVYRRFFYSTSLLLGMRKTGGLGDILV